MSKAKIREGSVKELKQDPDNANAGTERGALLLDHSIRTLGPARSIFTAKDLTILGGNKTDRAVQNAGIDDAIFVHTNGDKLVVVVRDDLEPDSPKARELAIVDNRSAEMGLQWDPKQLLKDREIIEGLDDGIIFSKEEFEQTMRLDRDWKPEEVEDDEFDVVPPVEPVTQPGDAIGLGDHVLVCGDATTQDAYNTLMAGQRADIVLTDPPYNVNYEGATEDKLTIENDAMPDKEFFEFLSRAFVQMNAFMQEGAGIYVFHADTNGLTFRNAFVVGGFELRQVCVWVKNSLVLGRQDFHWQHEPILYGWKSGSAHRWFADRRQTTVWNFDRPSRNPDHPTMKPVDLCAYPLQCSSQEGDIVLDPFGGSGSTMIAAEKTGRKARLIELDPRYCDVIVNRWEKLTGGKADRG